MAIGIGSILTSPRMQVVPAVITLLPAAVPTRWGQGHLPTPGVGLGGAGRVCAAWQRPARLGRRLCRVVADSRAPNDSENAEI